MVTWPTTRAPQHPSHRDLWVGHSGQRDLAAAAHGFRQTAVGAVMSAEETIHSAELEATEFAFDCAAVQQTGRTRIHVGLV